MKKLVIIFDPPHGEEVPGKRSPDGLHREYKWGREIISKIIPLLKDKGFIVENTNNSNKEIGLTKRQNFANNLKIQKDQIKFLVSLHNNAAGNGINWLNARGTSIYTSKGQTKSDLFADIILKNLMNDFKSVPNFPKFRTDISDKDLDHEENFTVLMGSSYSAVLLEWLFQDNKDDVKLLGDDSINTLLINSLLKSFDDIEKSLN